MSDTQRWLPWQLPSTQHGAAQIVFTQICDWHSPSELHEAPGERALESASAQMFTREDVALVDSYGFAAA